MKTVVMKKQKNYLPCGDDFTYNAIVPGALLK